MGLGGRRGACVVSMACAGSCPLRAQKKRPQRSTCTHLLRQLLEQVPQRQGGRVGLTEPLRPGKDLQRCGGGGERGFIVERASLGRQWYFEGARHHQDCLVYCGTGGVSTQAGVHRKQP